MISVAMATFNGEKYILKQLDSIKNQSCPPDEVIICDDKSSDNTVEIVKKYIHMNGLVDKWKIIVNDNNLGYIKNFIKAITLTTGDYVFLSDQDDVFYYNKFKTMKDFFEKHSDCVLVNANFEIIDEYDKKHETYRTKSRLKRDKKGRKINFTEWLYTSSFPGFSMAIRACVRDRLKEVHLDNCYGHDQLIGLIAIDMDGNYVINDTLSGYRIHSQNTTGGINILNSYSVNNRIAQKEKELKEYEMLKSMILENKFRNIDFNFIELRKKELLQRISCLKKRNVISLFMLIIYSKAYPKNTILGDILCVVKEGHHETFSSFR